MEYTELADSLRHPMWETLGAGHQTELIIFRSIQSTAEELKQVCSSTTLKQEPFNAGFSDVKDMKAG